MKAVLLHKTHRLCIQGFVENFKFRVVFSRFFRLWELKVDVLNWLRLEQGLSSLIFKAKERVEVTTNILSYSVVWLKRNRTHCLVLTFIQLS